MTRIFIKNYKETIVYPLTKISLIKDVAFHIKVWSTPLFGMVLKDVLPKQEIHYLLASKNKLQYQEKDFFKILSLFKALTKGNMFL